MTEVRKQAGVYVRISHDREGRALGVERQEEAGRELCARLGYAVAAVYRDNDVSASRYGRRRRPEYQRMLADGRAGRLDVIVGYSTSRLTRRPRESEDLIDLADAGRVLIRTVAAGDYDLTTAAGRMAFRIAAAVDAQHAEVTSELRKAQLAQRAARGLPNGGTRPFGWEKDGLTPHPVEFPALQAGIRDAIAGVSLHEVARRWSIAKRSTVTSTTVRRVLLSERIAGRLPDGRPAAWEPAATPDQVAAVRGALARPSGPGAPACLLTGWALCGLCRAPVHGAVNRLGVGCYECSAAPHLRVSREPRDGFVRQLVAAYLDRERVAAERDSAPLLDRHAAISAQLGEIADALGDGELTREQATRATARARARLAEVERTLAVAAAEAALPRSGATFVALDVARQRAVLAALPWRVLLLSPGRGARRFDPASVRVEEVGAGQG